MSSEDLGDDDYAVLAAFRFELRGFLRFSENAARATGLTTQQHQILLAIRAALPAGVAIGQLGEQMMIRSHTATGLVDRLETLDLVRRAPADDDRRRVRVQLTPAGVALLASLSAAHRDELRRLRPLLRKLVRQL